ncbi:hypothetical protein QBC46DRAFT_27776 [Diplogelasinospora grovesii]|uniref:Alternative oxidase n=1 Tax=Diplogelasinospora grovesii TaxID=303347 RepID=A0AAN6NEI8_9PEZI|nr:hypothetical protein QBC46DRAFT_27776 [Diplogelasinospora grovesii]
MLGSSTVFQLLKIFAPLVLLLWSLGYFISYDSTYAEVVRKFKDEKGLFVSDFLEHEIDGEFDGSGIADLCASKQWTPGLILSCDPAPGGVGQVKNAHLNCIRFAMEMGAELVMPQIIKRHEKDITVIVPPSGGGPVRGQPIDFFFDSDHLHQALAQYCPQMKVYKSMDDLYDVPSVFQKHPIGLEQMHVHLTNGSIIDDMSHLPQQIKDWINKESPPEKRKYPIRYNLPVTNFAFPTAFDKPAFARNYGRILRIRQDARRLAASALYNMQKKFGLNLDPRNGIKTESFVGVHLRTEKDADQLFPDYETQAAYLLDYIASSKARVAFMATGATEEHVKAFSARARDFNVTVVLKRDILEGEDLALLDKFGWDQRALIDYEIMLRAGLMAGPSESSFAWNLALRRKNAYGASSEGRLSSHTNAHVQWQDKFSTIFGGSERGLVYSATIWP